MFENAGAARAGAAEPAWRPAGGQHLRNLGKAVGARVSDLLRRKEPAAAGTEVNAAALGSHQPPDEDGAMEALPRLDPPPASGKKRVPRVLRTPQDMLIAPPEAAPQAPPSPSVAAEAPAVAEQGDGSAPGALPVPDLIHKGARGGSPCAHKAAERPPPAGSPADGPHPDLLAFD